MKCPKCQHENPEDSTFCGKCAVRLDHEAQPSFTKTIETSREELTPGTRLAGRYRIIEELGRGGMGKVYRAEDTSLSRQVAIKVLPEEFANNPERLARFKREARLLAALSHTNIASIYGIEEFEGRRFLVLELAEGETLRDGLEKGPLPMDAVLETCRQIAEGLEAAHEKGIVHRDLKPGNVMVSAEGKIKILDFGLAKAYAGEANTVDIEKSPTITARMTEPGVILGTAAYMSPEQARGRPADKRADIWAFGCILYECLTGKRTFQGETVSDTLALVLKSEPDWSELPSGAPANVRILLQRCLHKDPRKRLRDIGDAKIEIEDALAGAPLGSSLAMRPVSRWRNLFWAMGGLSLVLCSVFLWILLTSPAPAPRAMMRLTLNLPENAPVAPAAKSPLGVGRPTLALSPDGMSLVYVAQVGDETQLYLHRMDQGETRPIQGTGGAHSPFFSPDGRWIGFFAEEKLKKIPLSGGKPEILCAASLPFGGCWGPNNKIYFVPLDFEGIWQVSSAGGIPQPLLSPETLTERLALAWPEVLPDGDSLLVNNRAGGILIFSLQSGKQKKLLDRGMFARYSPSGHIIYGDGGRLRAVAFDLDNLEVKGLPVTVLDGIRTERQGATQYILSTEGSLIYVSGMDATLGTLTWVDRNGKTEPLGLPRATYGAFKISPNGGAIAIPIVEEGNSNISIYSMTRRLLTPLTFGKSDASPIWTPDGRWIVFSSKRGGSTCWYRKPADGSGEEEPITDDDINRGAPLTFSPAGDLITTVQYTLQQPDIWLYPFERSLKAQVFLQTPFYEGFAAFSPDGRWIAYTSDESGRWEIYVRPYPGPGGKKRVSIDGGEESRWSQNGEELFFRFGNKWMVSKTRLGEDFSADTPRVLFEGPYINIPGYSYDVSPDGQRFLVVEGPEQELAVHQIQVITNWFEELKRLVPAGK